MNDFLQQDFWGATIGSYLAFVLLALAALLLKKPLARLLARVTSGLATRFSGGKYRPLFRSLIRKPVEWLIAILLLFFAFNFIEGPLNSVVLLHWHRSGGTGALRAAEVIDHLFFFFAIIFITLLLSRTVDFIYRTQVERAHHQAQRERAQLLPLLKDVVKIVLWTMGFFWMLGVVFHVNIPALVTGLGIGGVALALAAKESIENLLASFTILADKPFSVGDTVKLAALEGAVERIGFRSTRLRTSDGSLVIVPNKKLIDENLENLSARATLHMRLNVPVKWSKPPQEIDTLLLRIREGIGRLPEASGSVRVVIESFVIDGFVIGIAYDLSPGLPQAAIADVKASVGRIVYDAVGAS